MSNKQAKRARQVARKLEALRGSAEFQQARPDENTLALIDRVLRESKGRPEEVWEVVSPWLWFPATPTQHIDYAALGTKPPVDIYLCRDYQVSVFDEPGPGNGWPGMWHLSIKRRDRAPIDHDRWRTLQIIKNTLVGPEHEAIELYPAESRLVDTANQYHIFVLKDSRIRFPVGYQERLVTSSSGEGAVQRPMPTTPEDEQKFADTVASLRGLTPTPQA